MVRSQGDDLALQIHSLPFEPLDLGHPQPCKASNEQQWQLMNRRGLKQPAHFRRLEDFRLRLSLLGHRHQFQRRRFRLGQVAPRLGEGEKHLETAVERIARHRRVIQAAQPAVHLARLDGEQFSGKRRRKTPHAASQLELITAAELVLRLGGQELLDEISHFHPELHAPVPAHKLLDGGHQRHVAEHLAAAGVFLNGGNQGQVEGSHQTFGCEVVIALRRSQVVGLRLALLNFAGH